MVRGRSRAAILVDVRRFAALLLVAAACAADTEELALLLEDDVGCTADLLRPIEILSIEVYGNDEEIGMCALSRRCLFNVDQPAALASLADIEDALSEANQPLVDIEAAGANYLKIVGRTNASGCWSGMDHPACGEADLNDAVDGELPLTIRCDEPCIEEDVPLCP
jgi:hypothetical protein